MSFFSQNIKLLRISKGLKQLELCTSLNYKTSTWNNYERGVSEPSLDEVIRISHFFGIHSGVLIETNLTDAPLNKNGTFKNIGINAHLNPHPNAHLSGLNMANEPDEGIKKTPEIADLLAAKDVTINIQSQTIEQQKVIISLLQNQMEQTKYDTKESVETHVTHRDKRKSA